MVAPSTNNGAHVLAVVLRVLGHLRVPVALHKTEGPSMVVTFLGILVDTTLFELWLPGEKVMHLQSLIHEWIRKQACTRKELECLLGHLAHAASVVRPGQPFSNSCLVSYTWRRHPTIIFASAGELGETWHGGSASCRFGMGLPSSHPCTRRMRCTWTPLAILGVEHSSGNWGGSKSNGQRVGMRLTLQPRS